LESFAVSHRLNSWCISCFFEGIHFILTNPNSPNIVITPPQEKNETLTPAGGTVIKDQLLLHPFRYRLLSTLKLHRILTNEEFEEEEKYLYHGSLNANDLDGPPQDEKHVVIQELSAVDEEVDEKVDEEEWYLYGYT
jgi:hypothetical protein